MEKKIGLDKFCDYLSKINMDFTDTLNYELPMSEKKTHENPENSNRIEQMQKVQTEGLELFKKKNQDYGDAFANYGVVGVLVRMGDKIARLQSIFLAVE